MPPVEQTSYARLFFFLSLLLLGSILWAVWDEVEGRRLWKNYQRQFNRLELAKVQGEYEKERGRVGGEMVRLQAEIARRSGALQENPDYLSAKERLDRAQTRLDDVTLGKQFARSELDEAYYEYKHALEKGATGISERARVARLEERVKGLEADEGRLTAERDEARKSLRSLERPVDALEEERRKTTEKLAGLERRLLPIRNRTPDIQQVVVRGVGQNPFGEPVFIVDRCQTCHLAIDRSGFEDFPAPFKPHPQRDLFLGKHPVEKFGCTFCHQGQGEALNSLKKAHGEVEFWDRPLLRGPALQSACRKCHDAVADIPRAPVLSQGKRLFQLELGCTGCHLVKGYEDAPRVGPSLLKASQKFRPEWMIPWIIRPKSYLPKTRMPFFSLTEEESTAIAAFLVTSTEAAGPSAPLRFEPGPDPKAQAAKGEALFRERGCLGCHSIGGEGGDFAPDLSQVATKVKPDWLVNWLKDPKAYNPETPMPSLRLSDEEAQAIAAFLLTQGEPRPRPALEAKLKDPRQGAAGKLLVEQMGCYACHRIPGTEALSRPSVELTTFANKKPAELDYGDVRDIPETWGAWTFAKLKNPRIFSTDRISLRMPNFGLSDAEATALLTLLRSFNGDEAPEEFLPRLTPREAALERGRRLVERYNCVGCHVVEGKGGEIRKLYRDASLAPPSLNGQGAKVQPQWLFDFLKSPVPVRPWLKVGMPTFGLTDEEASALVRYFSAQDETREVPYVFVDEEAISPGMVAVGKKVFQDFQCLECHVQTPGRAAADLAPDLSLARRRLRPDWLLKWLEDPQKLQPGTRMPTFFSEGQSPLTEVWKGDAKKQIQALRDYLMRFDGGKGEVTGMPPDVITKEEEEKKEEEKKKED